MDPRVRTLVTPCYCKKRDQLSLHQLSIMINSEAITMSSSLMAWGVIYGLTTLNHQYLIGLNPLEPIQYSKHFTLTDFTLNN